MFFSLARQGPGELESRVSTSASTFVLAIIFPCGRESLSWPFRADNSRGLPYSPALETRGLFQAASESSFRIGFILLKRSRMTVARPRKRPRHRPVSNRHGFVSSLGQLARRKVSARAENQKGCVVVVVVRPAPPRVRSPPRRGPARLIVPASTVMNSVIN